MRYSPWLLVLCGCLVVAVGIIGLTHWAAAAQDTGAPAATAEPPAGADATPVLTPPPGSGDNPIVAVVVSLAETRYDQDPFDTARVRSATNRVKTLLYVRADGTLETKQVP